MQLKVAIWSWRASIRSVTQSDLPQALRLAAPSGSRREARTEAILRATLEELAAVGYSGLSIEAVAARVGIAKTTVYRRYPTKLDLVRAALDQFVTQAMGEPPDTGSLRGDLIAVGQQVVQLLSSVIGQSLFRTRLLDRAEPELDRMGKEFEAERQKRLNQIAARAVTRGEIASEADFESVLCLLSGSFLFKAIIKREPVTELDIARSVDILLHGASPASTRHRR